MSFLNFAAGLLRGETSEATAATERVAEAISEMGGESEAPPITSPVQKACGYDLAQL